MPATISDEQDSPRSGERTRLERMGAMKRLERILEERGAPKRMQNSF